MKPTVLLLLSLVLSGLMVAQSPANLVELHPSEDFENIHVRKLDSDSMASTFLIWVKSSVKEHYHAHHTEVVQIIDGEGTMTLGEDTFPIKGGDYIFIPQGTRHSVTVTSDVPLKALSVQTPEFDGSDRVFVTQE